MENFARTARKARLALLLGPGAILDQEQEPSCARSESEAEEDWRAKRKKIIRDAETARPTRHKVPVKEMDMSDWLHNLPVLWMGLVVFGFTYLVAAAIYALVNVLAVGERARSFKVISPGLLPPLGIIFALFVAFTASQVWTDTEKAKAEIDREASALRTVVILATTFPKDSESQLRGLIRRYIADAATQEWAMMANRTANLRAIPGVLAEAMQ